MEVAVPEKLPEESLAPFGAPAAGWESDVDDDEVVSCGPCEKVLGAMIAAAHGADISIASR